MFSHLLFLSFFLSFKIQEGFSSSLLTMFLSPKEIFKSLSAYNDSLLGALRLLPLRLGSSKWTVFFRMLFGWACSGDDDLGVSLLGFGGCGFGSIGLNGSDFRKR